MQRIELQKKRFADSAIQTSHMLKKCALQPAKVLKTNDRKANSLFRVGALTFEDYNYAQYNTHVLLVENSCGGQGGGAEQPLV